MRAPLLAAFVLAPAPALAAGAEVLTTTTATIAYPARGATLARLDVKYPRGYRKKRIYIDPGHGFPGNEGATTALCEAEQDAVLRIAEAVAEHLRRTGRFTVKLARTSAKGPVYERRLRDAARFGADAIISIHLDARGMVRMVAPPHAPELSCPRNDEQPGFGVLVSDRGDPALVARRSRLARSVAARLAEIGLPAYDGYDYGSLYDLDPTPGVFLDRRGLFMLRRPTIPSVIVETHHGNHLQEAERWREPETVEAFATALAAGLAGGLSILTSAPTAA